MSQTNKYLMKSPSNIKVPLVRQVSKFVFKILSCFGIYEEGDFPSLVGSGDGDRAGASLED